VIVGEGNGNCYAVWILVGKTGAMAALGLVLADYIVEGLVAIFSSVGNSSIEVYDFAIFERDGTDFLFGVAIEVVKIECECVAISPVAAGKNLACSNCDGASGFVGIDNRGLIAGKGWFAVNN